VVFGPDSKNPTRIRPLNNEVPSEGYCSVRIQVSVAVYWVPPLVNG
jgi:hypothetical protein